MHHVAQVSTNSPAGPASGDVQGYWTLPDDGGVSSSQHRLGNVQAATKMSSEAVAKKAYSGRDCPKYSNALHAMLACGVQEGL
jgi:hypothetical protein